MGALSSEIKKGINKSSRLQNKEVVNNRNILVEKFCVHDKGEKINQRHLHQIK